MKITMMTSRLSEALKKVSGVANGKSSVAILANVKIETHDGKVRLTTTDLDVTVVTQVDCVSIEEEGETTVPMRTFAATVSALPVGEVKITSDKSDKMRLAAGNSVFRISGLAASDFPKLPSVANAVSYEFSSSELRDMIRKTAHAMSDDGTRRTLMGMLFEFENATFKTIATDGRRLALAETDLPQAVAPAKYIVPSSSIQMILRVLEAEGDAEIGVHSTQMSVATENDVVYTKLIADEYPNYIQVIPNDTMTPLSMRFDRSVLMESISRVMIMSTDMPSVSCRISKGAVDVEVAGDNECGAHDKFPVKYDGETVTNVFNPKYLLDPLKAIADDEVSFHFQNGPAPVCFKTDNGKFIAVVMPLRRQ